MDYQYLTGQHLSGFETYKYSAIDTSPLSVYVMHPFWNWVVLLCPRWVAPNVLTFVGFLFTVGACLLLSVYDYEFFASSSLPGHTPIPHWVFLVCSISIFLAYTLDGIDGKQARRTRTSGPLGELFDHGLDSWTAVLIPTCLYSIFGRDPRFAVTPIRYYYVCWNVFLTFYSSHYEKYNTGVLFLPWGYDLSMIASTLLFLITYILGHECWKFYILGTSITTGMALEIIFYLSSFASNLPVVIWNIYKSYKDRTGKMRTPWEANRPLIPVVIFLSVCAIWAYYSPTNIINRDPRAFYLMSGTIFSNICCRLIVAQMSNTRCETYNWLLGPAFLCTGLAILVPSATLELLLLHALWVLSTAAHIHYGACVVRQMCRHFRISCFQITEKKPSD